MQKTHDHQTDKSAELSEAARGVVRDAGDPRIDAHLAALGLLPDAPPVPSEAMVAAPVAAPEPPELAPLRAKAAELETALAAARRQVRWLSGALAVALAVAVVAIGLLLIQPG